MRSFRRLIPLVIAIAATAGCSTNPSTGRSQYILFPPDQVAAMGAEATPEIIAEFGGEARSSQLRAYVDAVGQRVANEVEPAYHGIQWQFFVLDSDVVNAFALPGGRVFVTVGLLSRFDNEAQLAAVLGHEVGHVTARHVDERLTQQMTVQLGVAVIGASTESALINEGAGLLTQGVLLKFNRSQENESDAQGLKYMTAAGYDPQAMVEVMTILAEASRGERPPEILSTHPYPETRLTLIRRTLNGPYAYTKGDPKYQKYASRYQRDALPYLRR